MMKYICLLLTLKAFSSLPEQLSNTEGHTKAYIESRVNVITGDVCLHQTDITLPGLQPITIPRSYISSSDQSYGGWFIFQHLMAKFDTFYPNHLFITEPNGTELIYQCIDPKLETPRKKKDLKKPPFTFKIPPFFFQSGITNESHNYEQNRALVSRNFTTVTLVGHDGTLKTFHRIHLDHPHRIAHYLLAWERHPNQNITYYGYDDRYYLRSIHTKNPKGSRDYAWATFDWELSAKKNRVKALTITTSDHQKLTYTFISHKDKVYLHQIGELQLNYLEKNNQGLLLESDSSHYSYEYYGYEDLAGAEDDRFKKVKALFCPDGTFYRFFYAPNLTTVEDSHRYKRLFHFGEDLRLHTIEHYQEETLLFVEKLLWNRQRFRGLSHLDASGFPLFSKIYSYDNGGNIIHEKEYTQKEGAPPLLLNTDFCPIENNCPSKTTHSTYSQDGRNLLEKVDEKGITRYTYLPKTSLITSVITLKNDEPQNRTYYEYSSDSIVIQKSVDQGPSTPCYITKITPHHEPMLFGRPEVIEEYVQEPNSSPQLLSRTHLTYSQDGFLLRKDHFDSSGQYTHSTDLSSREDSSGFYGK